jgi:hypothetical protein
MRRLVSRIRRLLCLTLRPAGLQGLPVRLHIGVQRIQRRTGSRLILRRTRVGILTLTLLLGIRQNG